MSKLRFKFQTIEFDNIDIHIRSLRDNQQFQDDEHVAENLGISSANWPFFGIIWPSGHVLAQTMTDFKIEGKRILEIGCGLGLASLVLNNRHADISATDYHPEVESFLDKNAELNDDPKIPFIRTGWADEITKLGQFDLIIGSDLLYEAQHIELLSNFIKQHANPTCEVILVDPGRGHHAKFSKKMVSLGFEHSQVKPINTDYLSKQFKGVVLTYSRNDG
ncbi:class I SAM-dependent methyltransferase [Catenovulum maritimum]|uniref:Histidine kinase n=1 Tax=Catenovulum maritimum TaxID=1513271 RepID=A0A0J8GM88_9ALTE|nr:methyltransferase domain-containing protein [Catenovulum maritimum]KMT63890.1 histidine kinase [Catenovulum maritimum]